MKRSFTTAQDLSEFGSMYGGTNEYTISGRDTGPARAQHYIYRYKGSVPGVLPGEPRLAQFELVSPLNDQYGIPVPGQLSLVSGSFRATATTSRTGLLSKYEIHEGTDYIIILKVDARARPGRGLAQGERRAVRVRYYPDRSAPGGGRVHAPLAEAWSRMRVVLDNSAFAVNHLKRDDPLPTDWFAHVRAVEPTASWWVVPGLLYRVRLGAGGVDVREAHRLRLDHTHVVEFSPIIDPGKTYWVRFGASPSSPWLRVVSIDGAGGHFRPVEVTRDGKFALSTTGAIVGTMPWTIPFSTIHAVRETPPNEEQRPADSAPKQDPQTMLFLRDGGYYRARSGHIFGPLQRRAHGFSYAFPWIAKGEGGDGHVFTAAGRYVNSGVDHEYDLVAEVPAPAVQQEKPKLVLREGGYYKQRDGTVAGPLSPLHKDHSMYKSGYRWALRSGTGACALRTWGADGSFYSYNDRSGKFDNGYDLVEEVPAPTQQEAATQQEKPKLVLREGGYYKQRDGEVVGPLLRLPQDTQSYWEGYRWAVRGADGGFGFTWTETGSYWGGEDASPLDLVEEVPAPAQQEAATQQEKPKLVLREGGYYKQRDGIVVGPLSALAENEVIRYEGGRYRWAVRCANGLPMSTWTGDGKYFAHLPNPHDKDLVEEVPAPASVVGASTPTEESAADTIDAQPFWVAGARYNVVVGQRRGPALFVRHEANGFVLKVKAKDSDGELVSECWVSAASVSYAKRETDPQ